MSDIDRLRDPLGLVHEPASQFRSARVTICQVESAENNWGDHDLVHVPPWTLTTCLQCHAMWTPRGWRRRPA